MKLYKDGKVMQQVDKDQLDICLEAGWSRTEPVDEEALAAAAELEAQMEKEAQDKRDAEKTLASGQADLASEKEAFEKEKADFIANKAATSGKTAKIKPLKKD